MLAISLPNRFGCEYMYLSSRLIYSRDIQGVRIVGECQSTIEFKWEGQRGLGRAHSFAQMYPSKSLDLLGQLWRLCWCISDGGTRLETGRTRAPSIGKFLLSLLQR